MKVLDLASLVLDEAFNHLRGPAVGDRSRNGSIGSEILPRDERPIVRGAFQYIAKLLVERMLMGIIMRIPRISCSKRFPQLVSLYREHGDFAGEKSLLELVSHPLDVLLGSARQNALFDQLWPQGAVRIQIASGRILAGLRIRQSLFVFGTGPFLLLGIMRSQLHRKYLSWRMVFSPQEGTERRSAAVKALNSPVCRVLPLQAPEPRGNSSVCGKNDSAQYTSAISLTKARQGEDSSAYDFIC